MARFRAGDTVETVTDGPSYRCGQVLVCREDGETLIRSRLHGDEWYDAAALRRFYADAQPGYCRGPYEDPDEDPYAAERRREL